MKNTAVKNAIHKIIPYMRGSKGDSSLVGLYLPFLDTLHTTGIGEVLTVNSTSSQRQ